jgi:MoxR-like ATPase
LPGNNWRRGNVIRLNGSLLQKPADSANLDLIIFVQKFSPMLRPRLSQLIDHLSAGLLERGTHVRLALLAALAGEHLLLIGPPGTAKSDLARRLSSAFKSASYFERLLTRFSVPEELFGPLSLASLEQDRYERKIEGYLPTASFAFIDEIFKANSAILNALLALLNEREYDYGAGRIRTPLISVIGASNEIPQEDFLAAFYDRFLLRCEVKPINDGAFPALLALKSQGKLHIDPSLQIARDEWQAWHAARDGVTLPPDIIELLAELRVHLQQHDIHLSDRRWHRLVGLLKTSAYTNGRNEVALWDLWLTQFCAVERPEQAALVEEWFNSQLGTQNGLRHERCETVVKAFETQLELEQQANDLAFDDSGVLSLRQSVGGIESGDVTPRLTGFMRRRRYGSAHIHARTAQIDELIIQINQYITNIDRHIISVAQEVKNHLWINPAYAVTAEASLNNVKLHVEELRQRYLDVRKGFSVLPQLEKDTGIVPEPIAADLH